MIDAVRVLERSRNSTVAGLVVGWILAVLVLDAGASSWQQRALGLATWLLLLALLRGEPSGVRIQVAVAVVFATWVEYTFAGALDVYTYRLHNIPSFVPPGHGLVYLGALALGRSSLFAAGRRVVLGAVLLGGGGWALWGLLLAPRPDVLGALWFGCLAAFILRGRAPLVYAGAFLLTAYLELLGTSLGIWTWGLHDPTGLLGIGNPPSGVAGGYCFFDAAALALAPRLAALLPTTRGQPARRRTGRRSDCRHDLAGVANSG
jgi:hypothetical protein